MNQRSTLLLAATCFSLAAQAADKSPTRISRPAAHRGADGTLSLPL